MAVGDIFKASFVHTLGLGQEAVFTMHYNQLLTTFPDAEPESLANMIWDASDGTYQQFYPASTILDRIEIRQVTGSPLQFFNLVLGEVGTMSGQQTAPQDAPLVSWYTSQLGRNQHGRIYLTPITESVQDAGVLSNTVQDSIQEWAEGLISLSDALLTTWQLVVYHREDMTFDDVSAAVVREDLKSQRRRQVGVGI